MTLQPTLTELTTFTDELVDRLGRLQALSWLAVLHQQLNPQVEAVGLLGSETVFCVAEEPPEWQWGMGPRCINVAANPYVATTYGRVFTREWLQQINVVAGWVDTAGVLAEALVWCWPWLAPRRRSRMQQRLRGIVEVPQVGEPEADAWRMEVTDALQAAYEYGRDCWLTEARQGLPDALEALVVDAAGVVSCRWRGAECPDYVRHLQQHIDGRRLYVYTQASRWATRKSGKAEIAHWEILQAPKQAKPAWLADVLASTLQSLAKRLDYHQRLEVLSGLASLGS